MFFKLISYFLATLIVCSGTYAARSVKKELRVEEFHKDIENNDNYAQSMPNNYEDLANRAEKLCRPSICPRIYKPICAAIDGIPLTSPTMCHFNDKVRCFSKLVEPGKQMPEFRVLHQGPCNGNENNILRGNKRNLQRPEAVKGQGLNRSI